MGWLSAVDGYEVALVGGKVAGRRVGGRPLRTVPKPVREHDTTQGLIQAQEWTPGSPPLHDHVTENPVP